MKQYKAVLTPVKLLRTVLLPSYIKQGYIVMHAMHQVFVTPVE